MDLGSIGRQVSAGVIVGLSAVIYSISYGALLFSGPLAGLVGFGITVTLITAIFGALFGALSEEKTFIGGPDSNTVSVLASMLAVLGSMGLAEPLTLNLALATILLTSLVCALSFYAVARFNLASLVRYIPFSVMAGFLASTGWLMSSGALNIISGTPLTRVGLTRLWADPLRPELGFGLLVVVALYALVRRVPGAILIPLVMVAASVLVNLPFLRDVVQANRAAWLFTGLQQTPWLPPWELAWSGDDLVALARNLPGMLVVSFVGLLTILLSVASLELSFRKEFDLNRVLRMHAYTSVITAGLGGFIGIVSIGRTMLNHQTRGGAISGVITAVICLAMLLGAGGVVAYIPKAALGGLVLYLGLNMLRQWVWDQRRTASRLELTQIVLILALVANFGFLVGFAAGVLISCIIFVVTYSRIPLASLATNLGLFTSSVVRPQHQVETLKQHGGRTVIYRLTGYVFFGSASKIDSVFQQMDIRETEGVVIDFTNVTGIDRSALGVFQRILRRYHDAPTRFHFVHAENNRAGVLSLSADPAVSRHISYYASLDYALEAAEEYLINRHGRGLVENGCFEFLDGPADREIFLGYCEHKQVGLGEHLCREGEFSNEVFFVESGSLDIIKSLPDGTTLRLAKLHQGAVAGELAFSTGEARTASIVAVIDSRVHVLHKDALNRMRTAHPGLATQFDHMVIRKISQSLSRTNKLMATLS